MNHLVRVTSRLTGATDYDVHELEGSKQRGAYIMPSFGTSRIHFLKMRMLG
jgi:hypothetical protein